MSQYLLLARKKHTDKDKAVDEFFGLQTASIFALTMFNRYKLDRVVVVRVDEEYEVVYKQESICKHPNIQQEFDESMARVVPRCQGCLEVIREVVIGEGSIYFKDETPIKETVEKG